MEPKDRIVLGAGELFFKYGIKSVTMDDIAKHLGISKKTIYQFFDDKDQLVLTLMANTLLINQESFDAISKSAKDPIHEIVLTAEHMRNIFTQINPIVFSDMKKYYPEAWIQFRQFKEKCIFERIVTIKSIISSYPNITRFIGFNRQNIIIAYRRCVPWVVSVNSESTSIIFVKTIPSGKPHLSNCVLMNCNYRTL